MLGCSIVDNLLFSDHVPLKIRLDLDVDHMFGRNYCHMLAWHKVSTERIDQYRSEFECKLSTSLYDKGVLQCKNYMCRNMLMNYLDYIMRLLSMRIKAFECIPATSPKLNSDSAGGRRKVRMVERG